MRRLVFPFASVLSLTALLLVVPSQLRADGLDTFTFSENIVGPGQVTLTWQLPAAPTPDDVFPGQGFDVLNIPATLTIAGSSSAVVDSFGFFNSSSGLPWQLLDLLGVSLGGVNQLYSGPESSPVFIAGTYAGFDPNNCDATGAPNSATLTIVSTPEPSSRLMLFAGLLALGGVLLLKKAAN
jgi:hypothetical protein